ncbi:hypothetical protein GC175_17145 [bacterium]|nr:hypothetical protein [bacterium]
MFVATKDELKEAEDQTRALVEKAFGAKEVTVDGKTMQLCPSGRLARAWWKVEQALQAGDQEAATAMRTVIQEKLEPAVNALVNEATEAVSAYNVLCTLEEVKAVDLWPERECTCEGCQLGKANGAYWNAFYELQKATKRLLGPWDINDPLPHLVSLVEAQKDKEVLGLTKELAWAMKKYGEAARAVGRAPQWGEAIRVMQW